MGDLSLLSHQYHALAELARRLKSWGVQVRSAYHGLAVDVGEDDNLPVALGELATIARFLGEVIGLEDEGSWPEQWLADPPLPPAIVDHLRAAHVHDRPLYISRVQRLATRLQGPVSGLTEKDLELLDSIVLAVNADASAVFRRLMRWA